MDADYFRCFYVIILLLNGFLNLAHSEEHCHFYFIRVKLIVIQSFLSDGDSFFLHFFYFLFFGQIVFCNGEFFLAVFDLFFKALYFSIHSKQAGISLALFLFQLM